MSTLAIEINDAGLIVADREGVLAVEPGYALVTKHEIVTAMDQLPDHVQAVGG